MVANLRTKPALTNSHGNTVNIVTWFLLVSSILANIARVLTKRALNHNISLDDASLLVAQLFGIAQTVAISLQVASGLGQHIESLESAEITRYLKSTYASNICFILALCASKISLLLFTRALTPVKTQRRAALVAGGLVVAYGVTGIFVVALGCAFPHVWDFIDGTCVHWITFGNYFCTGNIVTECMLMLLPLRIIWGLQTTVKKKLTILVCFESRLVVVIATICQLAFLNQESSSHDMTFTTWKTVLAVSVVQNTSIITACIPFLKPLLESLETGMMRSDDVRRLQGHHRHLHGAFNSYKPQEAFPKPGSRTVSMSSTQQLDDLAPRFLVKVPPRTQQEDSSQAIQIIRSWTVDVAGGVSY